MDPNMKGMRVTALGASGLVLLTTVLGVAAGCNSSSSPQSAAPLPPSTSQRDSATPAAEGPAEAEVQSSGVKTVAYLEPVRPGNAAPAAPKFDPIAENGKYFEGWPKPKLALVISGRQDGYLEPCGCAGLENQKGGLSRRYTFIKQLRARGWPVAAVDVGGLVRRFGKQAEIQFGIAADALKTMGYGAVGFGPADLRLSAGEIVAAVAAANPADTIFVSANVSLFGLTPKVRIIEAGGMKLGITAILGKEYQQQVNNSEVEIEPADVALRAVMGELKGCDVRILLANATTDEAKALAKQFPTFDLVVEAGGADVPLEQPEKIAGTKARLIEVANKAQYVIVAGFYDDPKQPMRMRFQRVALDSRFGDSAEMKQFMTTYQQQLQALGWKDLGLKRVPHPRSKKGDKLAGQFASAASCKECHQAEWDIWSKSKHAQATESLAKLDPPRLYDPECISCHSTGWNPGEFSPYASGFDSLQKTPELAGNSCDNCHGPGAAHVAAEKGRNPSKRDAEREALKLTVAFARDNVCAKCHDHDNSPNFTGKDKQGRENFDTIYWPQVEH
jgi:hypothetical protein